MRYVSTRGAAPVLDFEKVTLAGLAADGGLYVPEALADASRATRSPRSPACPMSIPRSR